MRKRVTRRRSRRSSAGRNSLGNRTCKVRSCFFVASGTELRKFDGAAELAPTGGVEGGRGDRELSSCVTKAREVVELVDCIVDGVATCFIDVDAVFRCGEVLYKVLRKA